MSDKPIVRRSQARLDIENAADFYFNECSSALELRFVDAVEAAMTRIAAHPASGSMRHAEFGQGSDLRFWQVKRVPYLIFYVEHATHVDVWRVLLGERDLPHWLR